VVSCGKQPVRWSTPSKNWPSGAACVAVGIRGDTFHNATIADAKFIATIHPDPEVPIFQVANLCLEAEPKKVLPALLEVLEE